MIVTLRQRNLPAAASSERSGTRLVERVGSSSHAARPRSLIDYAPRDGIHLETVAILRHLDFPRVERKRMSTRLFTATGRLAAFVLLSLPLLSVAIADEGDPPGRVARLSYTQGTVSLQPAGVQDWAAAVVNRPLTTGDKLWTDQDSRAELDTGAAVIRLGSTTGLTLLNLDDHAAQMRVTAGTLIGLVRELLANQTAE